MFVGEFSHTIDNKGRLIIPSKFREEIGDQKLIVVPWWEENLSVFTQEGFREYVKSSGSETPCLPDGGCHDYRLYGQL